MPKNTGRRPYQPTLQEMAYEELLQFASDLYFRLPEPPSDMNPAKEEAKRFYQANRQALQLLRAKGRELGLRDENGNWIKVGE